MFLHSFRMHFVYFYHFPMYQFQDGGPPIHCNVYGTVLW